MSNSLSISQIANTLAYFIDRNKELVNEGHTPLTIGIEGPAGLGKTSIVEEVARERGMTYCQLNLSQLEEVGDLTGFPLKEFEVIGKNKDGETITKWVTSETLSKLPSSVTVGKTRMSYAPPAWLPTEENPNGTILLLDDFTRANSLFMQAVMELISKQQYISWKLPQNTSIILTSNPDDGEYSVSSLDAAQSSRFINLSMKLDIKEWAKWAEKNNIDGRSINFALYYENEIFNGKKKKEKFNINPRNYTMFCKAVGGIKNWSSVEGLALAASISNGCFPDDKEGVIGRLFTMFVNNRLDKWILPEEMLNGNIDTVITKLQDAIMDNGRIRPEISTIMCDRFINYVDNVLSTPGSKEKPICDRIIALFTHPSKIMGEDLTYMGVRELFKNHSGRLSSLIRNNELRDKLLN